MKETHNAVKQTKGMCWLLLLLLLILANWNKTLQGMLLYLNKQLGGGHSDPAWLQATSYRAITFYLWDMGQATESVKHMRTFYCVIA